MAIAIITGASAGIGRELSVLCAKAGYDLVVVARDPAKLRAAADEIGSATGRRVRTVPLDLARPEAPPELHAECQELLGDIEILINNAGIGFRGPFAELDAARQMQIVHLNVGALTHITRLFLPAMLERRRGRIMNVASTAAFQPGPLMAVYYASKAYVLSLSEALHNELRGSGVTVTTLCPGPTATEFQGRAGMVGTRLFERGVAESAEVARAGFDAMMAGKSVVIPGAMNRFVAFSTRFAPRQLAASIARRLQEAPR